MAVRRVLRVGETTRAAVSRELGIRRLGPLRAWRSGPAAAAQPSRSPASPTPPNLLLNSTQLNSKEQLDELGQEQGPLFEG